MAHLFRNRETGSLYIIEELILDMKHLNGNGFRGVYAFPFNAGARGIYIGRRQAIVHTITHTYEKCVADGIEFNPKKFIEDNFEVVAELHHI